MNKGKVSVIIPAYNNEIYLSTCIESVLNQTYDNFEIIIINDGSEDDTLFVAKKYEKKYSFIRVIDNENRGQGYSRNYALKYANGEYILFLDSDDFLEPVTLETTVNRIIEDKSDLVVFDWKYYKTINKTYAYVNKDKFFNKKILQGEECLDLLTIRHYFTVNKLYSKKFLEEKNVKYGEGYIYEDIEFWVRVAVNAEKVSLIHSPLYNVRISKTSTTKTNYDTDYHCSSYLKAVDESMKVISGENKKQHYYLYKYLIGKFFLYYEKRTPKEYKEQFIKKFVEEMSIAKIDFKYAKSRFVKILFKMKVFEKKKVGLLKILYKAKNKYKRYVQKIKKLKNSIKRIIKKILFINKRQQARSWRTYSNGAKKDIILFMGFDYNYTGNSRYLFEQILKERDKDIYFATEDERVDEKYRVKPNSEEFLSIFYNARIVIFESWVSNKLIKTAGSIWIQLWHGTPLKKMLYDSEEKEIISVKPNHKIMKFNDIKRWNYFITDNENINKYFERAFLVPRRRILPLGYPRVEYLVDNKDNSELKKQIKEKTNIPFDKKIVTYLPTWRDYNYGVEEKDIKSDYFLDVDKLKEQLGNEYMIVSKNHVYLNKNEEITNIDLETQELLLISDYLITDYSSVMFDAFAIDLPVILLAKDYQEYMESRGVYEEIWGLMKNITCKDEEQVAEIIKNYNIDSNYNYIKEELCYKNNKKDRLYKWILKIAERKGKLIRNVLVFGDLNHINKKEIEKIKLASKLGSEVVFGITGCKNCEDDNFKDKKEIAEQFKGINLVIPIIGDKPTQKEIEDNQIDTIITDENDCNNYNCDIEYI